jgi:uncharacterized MnhB-related membrane protein
MSSGIYFVSNVSVALLLHYKVCELESLKQIWQNMLMDAIIAHSTLAFTHALLEKLLTSYCYASSDRDVS